MTEGTQDTINENDWEHMKIQAKIRLAASRDEPTDGGASFDMSNDGKRDAPDETQELLTDDGTTEVVDDQDLLNDDLPVEV